MAPGQLFISNKSPVPLFIFFLKNVHLGVDFLSQGVIEIFLRERPKMVKWKTFELALWKAREVDAEPLRAEACFPI